MTIDKGHPRKKILTVTSSTFRKYQSHPRQGTEPHVSKTNYKVSDHSHTNLSHGENYIQVYEEIE